MTQEDRANAAVSGTLGYILLFAFVTLSVSVIYMVGYPALKTNMEANVFEGAEQSFIVLQSDLEMVAFEQVPLKVLKMKLQGSSISVSNESSMLITYDGNPPLYIPTGEIVFELSDDKVIYQAGGVFKAYSPDADVLISKPPMYVADDSNVDVTTLGIVSLKGNDFAAGRGIATLNLRHNSSTMNMSSSTTNVTLQVNSQYASEWEEHLESIGFSITNITSSNVTAQKNDTMLILSMHEVDVDIT